MFESVLKKKRGKGRAAAAAAALFRLGDATGRIPKVGRKTEAKQKKKKKKLKRAAPALPGGKKG
mgnify:CR=1 FL=1